MTFFPVLELIDRLAIADVKFKRTGANHEELTWYMNACVSLDMGAIEDLYLELIDVHNKIWNLEAELKSGREAELDLAEIGRRAIEIRDWNRRRIEIKNTVAERLGSTVREIKADHLSQ
jgi:hypothetical protein